MRKLFVMALAIALFMSLGATSALATGGGGGSDNGKPCNPNSPAGQAGEGHHPGCNDPGNGNGNGNGNGCKDKDKNDKHKCPPGHGCKPHHDDCEVPEGNCEEADLVLFEGARIVCLYFGEKAALASKLGDCPDALIAGGGGQGDLGLGACVFLPPDTDEDGGTPGVPGLPGLPGLPGGGGGTPGLPELPGLPGGGN